MGFEILSGWKQIKRNKTLEISEGMMKIKQTFQVSKTWKVLMK